MSVAKSIGLCVMAVIYAGVIVGLAGASPGRALWASAGIVLLNVALDAILNLVIERHRERRG